MQIIEVTAIIRDDNKSFVTQRGYGEFKGGWGFPVGKLEEDEKLEEALKPEIRDKLVLLFLLTPFYNDIITVSKIY